MVSWNDLDDELQRWSDAGEVASLWWRDDDAGPVVPELERLLALSKDSGVPVSLAVIPQEVGAGLKELLAAAGCAVLQHGLGHRNHAPRGEKKAEFGAHRPVYEMLADTAIGFESLRARFGACHLPVFVPPWNRIAPDLVARLPSARIAGLSSFKPRATATPAWRLHQANCHVDPVDWRDGRRFAGTDVALAALVDHLRGRRLGDCDRDEPTGVLTHHRIHDDGMWSFLEQLFGFTQQRDGAHWLTGAQVFRLPR